MKKILVTAFEPFGVLKINPSARMLSFLEEREGFVKILLPTSFEGARKGLVEALEIEKPEFALLTGVAAGRSEICLEYAALNVKDAALPDNDGERASGQRVVSAAPNALFTTLDLHGAVLRLKNAGLPCRVSYHAGTYVCNSTYFHLLLSGVPGVFVHLPSDELSRQNEEEPFLPIAKSVAAMEELLSFFCETR